MSAGKGKPKPVVYLDDKDRECAYDPKKGQTAVSLGALLKARERESDALEPKPAPKRYHPLISGS